MKKWILYVAILGFAAYWASNLLLWFPWSYSTALGITMMLTVAPLLWAYVIYLGLKTYPNECLSKGALIISSVFLLIAMVMDYIFFGLIRNAMEELYHPTTFYGYGFLIALPFLLGFTLKNKIERNKKPITNQNIIKVAFIGLAFFIGLVLILLLGIEL